MAAQLITLKVSEEIALSTEVADTYVPASGKTVTLVDFFGDAAFTKNSVVKVVWDYGGTEVIVWSTKGSINLNSLSLAVGTGDGVKKVAVVCDNGEVGNIVMAGMAIIKVN